MRWKKRLGFSFATFAHRDTPQVLGRNGYKAFMGVYVGIRGLIRRRLAVVSGLLRLA